LPEKPVAPTDILRSAKADLARTPSGLEGSANGRPTGKNTLLASAKADA
jgi:hypothetical protein